MHGYRNDITVADLRHRDERPVGSGRHVKDGVRRPNLAVVDSDAEDDGSDHHEKEEEEHLKGARSQRHDQNPQAEVVLAELERAQHSENVEHHEDIVCDINERSVG